MKLVLNYSDTQSFEPLQLVCPVSLIFIMGKPLIQHQLELSYSQGIRHCTIIASNNLEHIRRFCGDGSRFGVELDLVTAASSGEEVESLLRHRNLLGDHCLILAGRTIANLPMDALRKAHDKSKKRISVIRHKSSGEIVGLLTSPPSPGDLLDNHKGSLNNAATQMIQEHPDDVNIIDADFPHFVCRSLSEVLRLTATVLDSPSDYIHNTHFAQQDDGIYLGHHTMIHPSAVLQPPVAIGDFCQVLEGAKIGPYATISSGSIVAKGATVSNAIVSPYSYLGEMMEVQDAIVTGSTLVQPLSGTKVLVSDPLLLDSIEHLGLLGLGNSFVHRAVALGAFAALFPMGLSVATISKLRGGHAFVKVPTMGHGDIEDAGDVGWLPRFNRLEFADKSLPLSWYPTLLNVLKGEMRFIGPKPVAPYEKLASSVVQNAARYCVPPGLFAVGDLFDEASEEAALAEAIYAKKHGFVQDVRCAAAKVVSKFIGKRKARWLSGL